MATRSFVITAQESGQGVGDVLRRRLGLSRPEAERLVRDQRVRLNGRPCRDIAWRVRAGQRLEVQPRQAQAAVPAAHGIKIRYADAHVVVVDKPSGLTTMRHASEAAEFGTRARRFLPATLADLLPPLLAGKQGGKAPRLRAVHRLDRDTSGLVVFARTAEAERHLGRQFRAHTIHRRYLALVRGRAVPGRVESHLVRDRGDGRRGSAPTPGTGQRAVTHIEVVEELGDFTLVTCRLETGRTHQVRIHLGERGTPICGERVYDRPLHGRPVPDTSGAPRLALHATLLGFEHPATGQRMQWESPLPQDLSRVVASLRSRGKRGTSMP